MRLPGTIELTRDQVLAHRRRVQAIDQRLPRSADSLRRAAWAGLQDSVPRSALHSLHARVEAVTADTWEDPALVQVWGPRYTAYVVPVRDHLVFTLGRMPDVGRLRQRAEELARRLRAHLDGRRLQYGEAGRALGVDPNSLRYAALTGSVLIRWEGARQPMIWNVPLPEIDPLEARLELARRYLHVYGPATMSSFVRWSGLDRRAAVVAFDALGPSLVAVRTTVGEGLILDSDAVSFRAPARAPATARLLPSGDPYFLLHGADRELLVPDAARRPLLWTPRVWPGAVLVDGEIVGTWRRSGAAVMVCLWRGLSVAQREAVESEATTLPLPDSAAPMVVRWDESDARPGRVASA